MNYPEFMVAPMRQELTSKGFQELKSADEVKNALNQKGTALVVVNSVCGCAARNARPGAIASIEGAVKPDQLLTVFAGMEIDAVNEARQHMAPFPPSSPSIALFKDGQLVHILERHHIEGRPAEMIADKLKDAYQQHSA